nr:ORF3 [Epsilontorquevirus sp.]
MWTPTTVPKKRKEDTRTRSRPRKSSSQKKAFCISPAPRNSRGRMESPRETRSWTRTRGSRSWRRRSSTSGRRISDTDTDSESTSARTGTSWTSTAYSSGDSSEEENLDPHLGRDIRDKRLLKTALKKRKDHRPPMV